MHSSIFSFSAARVALFALPLLALVAPYELIVRSVEQQFGRHAQFGFPTSDQGRLEWFLVAQRRAPANIFVIGNSQCQYGIAPDQLAQRLGASPDRVFNLSFAGASFLTGLQVIRQLEIKPDLIIACVSPADFTDDMFKRGAAMLQHLPARTRADGWFSDYTRVRESLESRLADGFHAVIRASEARYRRAPQDYWHLLQAPELLGDPVRRALFVSTGQTGLFPFETDRYRMIYYDRGYVALEMTTQWDRPSFERLALDPVVRNYRTTVFPDYRQQSAAYFKMAGEMIKNSPVVLVRLPTYGAFTREEDRQTSFPEDIRTLAKQAGAPLIMADEFSADLSADLSNYRDAVHLHEASARAFTAQLGTRLCALDLAKRAELCRQN